jgi:hypothetical protein
MYLFIDITVIIENFTKGYGPMWIKTFLNRMPILDAIWTKDFYLAFASFQTDLAVSLFNLFLDFRGSFGFYNISFLT